MALNQYDVAANGSDMTSSVVVVVGTANPMYSAGNKVEVLVDTTISKLAIIRGLLAVIQKIITSSWG